MNVGRNDKCKAPNNMNILDDLKYRELIYQITDEKGLEKKLANGQIILYCGFDPSADSLHLGNLLQILILRRFQLAGHKPIALVGGATGLIGDPSGKKEERQLNLEEVVIEWGKKIKKQLEKFLDFDGDNKAEIVNNYDWLGKMTALNYLCDIGKNFSVNEMLAKESVKTRLGIGISFTEFNYMILQSIDFLELNKRFNCELQIGGSDQWGNITAGVDLMRKISGKEVFGLTAPLLTKADGSKFGKTESGTIWLDPEKTSPYEFYQFFINADDKDIVKLLKVFTFLSREEIDSLAKEVQNNPEQRTAQKKLAEELTKLVHGEKNLEHIEKISQALFYGNIKELNETEIIETFKNVPAYELKDKKEINLIDLLVLVGVETSKRQTREDLENGAIFLNDEKITDLEKKVTIKDCLHEKYLIIRKGKNKYFVVKM